MIRSQLHFRRVLCATYKCLLQEVSWAKPPEHVKTVANNTTNPAINGFEENGTGVMPKMKLQVYVCVLLSKPSLTADCSTSCLVDSSYHFWTRVDAVGCAGVAFYGSLHEFHEAPLHLPYFLYFLQLLVPDFVSLPA